MYVLVLTIALYGFGYRENTAAVSTQSVPGFQTNAACIAAGNAWLKQNTRQRNSSWQREVTALCVYQGAAKNENR